MKPKKKFIVDENGEKTAVVLDINEYKSILEDLEDLRIIAERRDEPTVKLKDVKKDLKDVS